MAIGIDATAQGSARRRKPPLGTPADVPSPAVLMRRPEDMQRFDVEAYARDPVAKPMMRASAAPAPLTGQPVLPQAGRTLTERQGGAIPTTSDVWRSQQAAAEFERRIETLQTEEQIRQLRDVSAQHAAQAEVTRRQGAALTAQAGVVEQRAGLRERGAGILEERAGQVGQRAGLFERQAEQLEREARGDEARAGHLEEQATLLGDQAAQAEATSTEQADILREQSSTRADVLRRTGDVQAADERRRAEILSLSKEQRNTQLQAFVADAQAQAVELRIAHLEEAAQMRVIGAAKGTGGAYTERLVQSAAGKMERKVGRIGTQVEARRRLRDIGVQTDDIQMEGAAARAAHIETVSEMQAFITERTGDRKAKLIEIQGLMEGRRVRLDAKGRTVQAEGARTDAAGRRLRADEARLRGEEVASEADRLRLEADEQRLAAEVDGLQADNLRIQAAQTFLRADAEAKSADYANTAARISDWALDNRPPIPDYIAIGKKQDRAQTMRSLGSAVGIIGGVASLGSTLGLW